MENKKLMDSGYEIIFSANNNIDFSKEGYEIIENESENEEE